MYRVPPGLFCVPASIYAITGADVQSVLMPSFNRHQNKKDSWLLDPVAGVSMHVARKVLEELGYNVRAYKSGAASGQLRAHVATWARRSLKWPGRPLLIATAMHCMALQDGVVYDNWEPMGCEGEKHPFARTVVTFAALIQKA